MLKLTADYWRSRANEARDQAALMRDEKFKRAMLGLAQNYDQLAEQAALVNSAAQQK